MLLGVLTLIAAGAARADGQILVAEVLPSLAGTEFGEVPIANAPPPGTTMVVRRSDVLRALDRAGMSGKDLAIPRMTRITREVVKLSKETLLSESMSALQEAAGACRLEKARISMDAKVVAGPRTVRAELPKQSSGAKATTLHVTGAVFVESGGQQVRVPVLASLACPEPEVVAGSQITVVARIGRVRATAPAEARQPGRIGEIIRVTNKATGAALRARIVDSQTAEVVP
jgi:hypothetical protein